MKILSSAINMSSSHTFSSTDTLSESVRMVANEVSEKRRAAPRISFSQRAAPSRQEPQASENDISGIGSEDPAVRAMRLVLEALTGKKIAVSYFTQKYSDISSQPFGGSAPLSVSITLADTLSMQFEHNLVLSHDEQENTTFEASGIVTTQTGEQIDLNLNLEMFRHFHREVELTFGSFEEIPQMTDPLVVNLSGKPLQLTDYKVDFDLDSDGKAEKMSFTSPGSGFLALDSNGDGIINNGSELFGPQSGRGFAELARFDLDNNGWLDENDPIFNQLKIWMVDGAGNFNLAGLKESGVGAMLLDNRKTDFLLTNDANTPSGQIRATSIFLFENGSVGSLQEVDLVV
ncbi:MAG: hypothetical protein KQH63_13045 [Desulfobulbaceae bacterium]|nr:hypothetical protein [Desulfobulbaceae bacterium]